MTYEQFGDRLRRARAAAGIRSAAEAARRLGISPSAYSPLENGKSMPGFDRVIHLSKTLGLDPRILVPEWFAGTVPVAYLTADDRHKLASEPPPEAKRGRGRPRKAS